MRARAKVQLTATETLLAWAVDKLSLLVWLNSSDGPKNINRPKSILSELLEEKEKPVAFATPAEFEKARENILRG